MRTIDVLTSQNVTINYELAPLRDRIFATIIDVITMIIAVIILLMILAGPLQEYVIYLFVLPIFFFYILVSEILMDGQTLGKKALGIKVIKLNGVEPSMNDFVIRWAFRSIDIWGSLGSIGCMLISSTADGQRLGDIVANTTVIRISPAQRVRLSDILNIRSMQNYTPVFPQVREFSEADMLLLKEVMDRYNRFGNQAHSDALHDAVNLVCEKLNIQPVPRDKVAFIRTLIKDYVALSR